MADNRAAFDRLMAAGEIDIARGPLFDLDPGPARGLDFGRVEGLLLGLAIGDALGRPTEGLDPAERHRLHGELRGYLPQPLADGRAVGLPSDDTQLTFWTLEQLVRDGGFRPARVLGRLAAGRVFGVGRTTREALATARVGALPWHRCGLKRAGSGAMMRIAPILLPHLRAGGVDLWVDGALACILTHNDSAAISAGLAWLAILRELLVMEGPPEPGWWRRTWLERTRGLEVDPTYIAHGNGQTPLQGTLGDILARRLDQAEEASWSVAQAAEAWGSGGYLLETVPLVLWILARHGGDPGEAILRAVNDTRDNDSIAALVGSAIGALHGHDALPRPWVEGLLGRTREDDDGQVFRLLAEAGRRFDPSGEANGGA